MESCGRTTEYKTALHTETQVKLDAAQLCSSLAQGEQVETKVAGLGEIVIPSARSQEESHIICLCDSEGSGQAPF